MSVPFSTNRVSRSGRRFFFNFNLAVLISHPCTSSLAIFPIILLGLRLQALIVLIPSFLLYSAVQIADLSVPAYPGGHVWYFNPLAWQFLFFAGAALGLERVPKDPWFHFGRATLLFAATIVTVGFLIKLSWKIHKVWEPFPGFFLKELWPVNKNNLSPIRLVNFFATLAVVATLVRNDAAFLRSRSAPPNSMWPAILGDFLPQHSAFDTRAFRAFRIQFGYS
jgi:hypothetical protein